MSYRINEIFYSLQGEGFNVGRPAVFIRFSGCNLSCSFCDTDSKQFEEMSVEDILVSLSPYPSHFLVLTGGEPALQIDLELLEALHRVGYQIAIETNGTVKIPVGIDWVTVAPKENSDVVLSDVDEVKVVYFGQDVEKYFRCIHARRYYLQPCFMGTGECVRDNRDEVLRYCLEHPHWMLSLQIHKILHIA